MSRLTLITLIVMMLIVSACNIGADAGADGEGQVLEVRDIEVLATQETFTGEMVTDTRIGFTFYYPEGWTFVSPGDVTNSVAYAYTMQSMELTTGGGGSLPEGETKIDLYVNPSDANMTLTSIENRLRQEDADNEILTISSIEPTALSNGREALTVRGTGMGGEFMSIHTIVKGYEVSGSVFGDEQHLLDVLNSIRETN
jgi:hypothetical protein